MKLTEYENAIGQIHLHEIHIGDVEMREQRINKGKQGIVTRMVWCWKLVDGEWQYPHGDPRNGQSRVWALKQLVNAYVFGG